jgi:hypothetical protein
LDVRRAMVSAETGRGADESGANVTAAWIR